MDNNNNKKYLNYAIFLLIVVVVVGLAVSHSRHMRNLVDSMAGPDRAARVDAAKELVKAEQFMDAVTGETVETRTAVVQSLEDWAKEPRVPKPKDLKEGEKFLEPEDAVTQLVSFMKDPDKPVRDRILVALLRVGAKTEENLKALIAGIKEGDASVRKPCVLALQILGQSDPDSAVSLITPEIVSVMRVKNKKEAAAGIFKERKPEIAARIVDDVVAIIKAEAGARASGGDVLAALPQPDRERAASLLIPLLDKVKNTDEGVRTGAADALGKIGIKAAVAPLKAAMHNDTAQVRRVAIGAIALIADPSGEDALTEAMNNQDDDNEARAQAATGLGRIATPTAIETLIKALSDYDLKVQVAAVSALARAGKPAIPRLLATLKSPTPELRARAAQALAGIADPSTNAGLIAALKDPDPSVRRAAAAALGFENNAAAVQPLIAALSDLDGSVASAAADALAHIGEPARSALANALSAASDTVAFYAAQALGEQGQSAVAAVQQETARSPRAQRWAVVALGSMGGQQAVSALQQIAQNADPETQEAARQALKKIGAL
jgi:HEAT repeat protein